MSAHDTAALVLLGAVVACLVAGWYVLAGFLALSIVLIPRGRG